MDKTHDGPGLLSSEQRKYLRGQADIKEKSDSERQMRERIRNRIHNAILDFIIVHKDLEDRDRDQIVEDIRADLNDEGELPIGLYWGIALAVKFGTQAGLDRETLVEEGLLRSERDITSVNAEIEVKRREGYEMGTLLEKLESGEKPTLREIGEAYILGEIEDINRSIDDDVRDKIIENGFREENTDIADEATSIWDGA